MEDMFLQLINLSLAVGMVILLAALVRPLLVRRYRRALLRGIWAVLAVRLLLPVSLPAAAVEMELPASLGQPVAARVAASLPGGESEEMQGAEQEMPAASQEKVATVPADLPAASPLELAALVWLAGAAVLAVVSIGRHLAWKRRVLTLAQPMSHARQQIFLRACRACGVRPPRLFGSPAVDTPLAFGLLRPAVLLPEREWTDGELYAVFCHELCHIRRGDLWLQGVIRLACWAHWFNPAVWLLARLAGEDMELACDERVLRLADAPAGRDYGRALLETACRVRPAGHTSCFSAAGRSLSRRLGAIVVRLWRRRWAVPVWLPALWLRKRNSPAANRPPLLSLSRHLPTKRGMTPFLSIPPAGASWTFWTAAEQRLCPACSCPMNGWSWPVNPRCGAHSAPNPGKRCWFRRAASPGCCTDRPREMP